MSERYDGATEEILVVPDFAPEILIVGREPVIRTVEVAGQIDASSSVSGELTVS